MLNLIKLVGDKSGLKGRTWRHMNLGTCDNIRLILCGNCTGIKADLQECFSIFNQLSIAQRNEIKPVWHPSTAIIMYNIKEFVELCAGYSWVIMSVNDNVS